MKFIKIKNLICVILIILVYGNAFAQNDSENTNTKQIISFDNENEEDSFDDEEENFEYDPQINNYDKITDNSDDQSHLWPDSTFSVSHKLSYGTKEPDNGVINNRSYLRGEFEKTLSDMFFVRFDGKVTQFFANDHVAEADNKDLYYEAEIREFYLQAGFESFKLRAGKQIIVWGETDGDVINDVVSPRNEEEFVFIDLEDSRIGQYMASLDIYSDYGDTQLFVIFKPEVNNTPDQGTRYYVDYSGSNITDEARDLSDREAGLKWKKTYRKFDVSLMTASLLQNAGVLEFQEGNEYKNHYGRYSFYGIGLNYTSGSFLYKLDASYKKGFSLQSVNANNQFIGKESDLTDTAIGVEYNANGRYILNFEITNRHIFDYSKGLYGVEQDNTGGYFQYLKSFLNETLEFQYIYFYQFQEKNSFHQVELVYSFSDDLQLTVDYTIFNINDEDSFLWNYRNEDRAGVELKFYF
ncbi:MAG: hypothetical protein GY834_16030 [Bacteroidetes bacterium]|nr:hypothetical protein [Bacteroidota bacterium]